MTQEQLRQMGFVLQPDGSYSRQVNHEAHPKKLPHPVIKPPARQTLERARPGKEAGGSRLICRITRYAPRPLDADNFAGGCKPLIDQLRYAGIIPNDDPASVELQFRQETVTGKGWTSVEICEGNTHQHP